LPGLASNHDPPDVCLLGTRIIGMSNQYLAECLHFYIIAHIFKWRTAVILGNNFIPLFLPIIAYTLSSTKLEIRAK
jgi:hypothetical protein